MGVSCLSFFATGAGHEIHCFSPKCRSAPITPRFPHVGPCPWVSLDVRFVIHRVVSLVTGLIKLRGVSPSESCAPLEPTIFCNTLHYFH